LFPSFFYRKATTSGELRGVGIEIARSLAERVGVALSCAEYPSPPQVVEALAAGACDVALLGIDPKRATAVDFSPPLLAADFSYLVPGDSAVRAVADADRPGMRIALVRHHAMDAALDGKLAHAGRVYADTPDDAFAMFRACQADVLGGIRPGLVMYARCYPARACCRIAKRNVIACRAQGRVARYLTEFVRQRWRMARSSGQSCATCAVWRWRRVISA
jgi:ABC-type amino acid transport substrate-binding protein